jgi:ABC-2 type transport system permease protein
MLIAERYFFSRFVKFEDLIDFIFWPLLDILVWGGVGLVMSKNGQSPQQVQLSIVTVVMMRVYLYSYFNNSTNFLYEMMARNIINLFATPLTFNEWLSGAMAGGCLQTVLLIAFATLASWFIFGIYILQSGLALILFIIPLLIFGWAMSSVSIAVLMLFGVHAQRLVWVLGWVCVPFSGAYYSLTIMPVWIQSFAQVVPMSYIFEALRIFVLEGRFSFSHLVYGYGLAIIYFVITIIACNLMFERSRRLGLASLERA